MHYLYISEVASNIIIQYKGTSMSTKTASRTPSQWISHLKSKGAPSKLIDQIKAIEQSGKDYGRSKEYIMRTIIDKIPKKYIEEPTAAHGPEKSGPKAEPKKKSIELELNDKTAIEEIIIKIADANSIDNVSFVTMNLTHEDCIVKFSCEEKKDKKRTEEMGDGAKLEA